MSRYHDAHIRIRTTAEQKQAVEALAAVENISAGELVRKALAARVAKSGPGLTPEDVEAVVAKATRPVQETLAALHARLDRLEAL